MKKSILIALAAIILSVIGCTKPEEGGNDNPPTPPQEQIIISQDQYNLKAEGGSITVEVSSNVAVTMTIPEDAIWITENKTKSVLSTSTFHLDIAANETYENRSAEITFSNEESGLSEKITVSQEGTPVSNMVDLGLSVKWATCNIGASKPEEYGDYYAWGETETYYTGNPQEDPQRHWKAGYDATYGYFWKNYKWCNRADQWPRDGALTKYNTNSECGLVDNKTVLDIEDDVAHAKLDGKWRMPTAAEWAELRDNCNWYSTQQNGINGFKVFGKKDGYTENYIFLPAAGCRLFAGLGSLNEGGVYWSSSLRTNPFCAYVTIFGPVSAGWTEVDRSQGNSVRPVYGDKVNVTGVRLDPTSISLKIGEQYTLRATITPSNAADKFILWTSSDTDVATVDQDGKVTAFKAGSATITATTTDGGYTATCNITVTIMSNIEDPEEGDDWEWDNSEKTTAK